MPRHRTPADIAGAIARLNSEPHVQLSELAGRPLEVNGVTLTPSCDVLRRWGTEGKAGVRLDVMFNRRLAAWVTSAAAIQRFRAALAAKVRAAG